MNIAIYAPLSVGGIGFLYESLKRRYANIAIREDRNAYRKGQGEPSGVDLAISDGLRIPMDAMRDEYNAQGKPVLITDLGYLRRDLGYLQLGINQLNWLPDIDCSSDRWQRLDIELKPQRQGGEYILITGQKPYDGSHGMNDTQLVALYAEWVNTIKKHTDRPIVFRPHPRSPNMRVPGTDLDVPTDIHAGGLQDVIKNAHAVVTYNSTSGTDALIAGVPVFAMSESAQFYQLANHDLADIEAPYFPDDRESHFNRVAYAQWLPEELRSGEALHFILERLHANYHLR